MDTVELIKRSIDLLEDLRDTYNETVAIAILDQQTAVGKIVARVEGKHGVTIRFDIDSVFPAHAGAPAKSIVAFLPEEEREAVLDKMNFERFTEQTICDKARFEQECEQIRKNGYSVDIAEHNAGCHCVAAPVFDSEQYPVAAVWITSFANRMPVAEFETRSQVIRKAAQTISLRIQGKSEDDTAWTDYLVNNATRYFQEHLDETIDMKQYADSLGVSYSWFRSHFRQALNESPKQFHLRLRIDKARELLLNTNLSIKEISSKLGYDNQNYFSNLFHKKIGQYPTDFRQNKR